MVIFILFLFAYTLNVVDSAYVMGTTRQEGPVSSYIGAAKTAKLLGFIQKMKESQKNYPYGRSGRNDEAEPSMLESMKLLQKNYDTSRKYNKDNMKIRENIQYISNPEVLENYKNETKKKQDEKQDLEKEAPGRARLQYISNPEVLETYKNQPSRRNEENEISMERQHSYLDEMKRSHINMHMFKKPEGMTDYRKHNKKHKKPETSSSESEVDDESVSSDADDDGDEDDDEFRRRIVRFRVDGDLEAIQENSADDNDVTMKPDEALDIVKPFIVEIFNKLKHKNDKQKQKRVQSEEDDDDFYDPKKIFSSEVDEKNVYKIDLREITTKQANNFWKPKEPQYTDKELQENDNNLRIIKNDQSMLLMTTTDQSDITDSWRKKEIDKNKDENISQEKRDLNSQIEPKATNVDENDEWDVKKLPASKKSFVEPQISHDQNWDDTGYGYVKNTDWGRKRDKLNSGEKRNKEDIDSITSKKNSREDSIKNSKRLDKDNSGESKKTEWNHMKNYDDWDKKENKNNDWDKPMNKKEKMDKSKKYNDDWDQPKAKNDDWNKSKFNKDDWNKPKNKRDDWDTPKAKKDHTWDTDNKNWVKNVDRLEKEIEWDKKDDSWDKKKDSYEKDDKWSKKDDDWNKKGDKLGKKKDDWNKKDDDWIKKDTKAEKKLPDNQKRDSGWDMVGLDNKKKGANNARPKQSFGDQIKKKTLYSEWGNYESYKKDKSREKKSEIKDDYNDDIKPKKKNNWDSFVPKFSNNYDRSQKHDSFERQPAHSGFGRTSIPMVGKKAVYAD